MKTRSSLKGEIERVRTGKEKKRANPQYSPPPRQPWSQYKKMTQHSLRLKQLPPRARFASSTLKRGLKGCVITAPVCHPPYSSYPVHEPLRRRALLEKVEEERLATIAFSSNSTYRSWVKVLCYVLSTLNSNCHASKSTQTGGMMSTTICTRSGNLLP